MLAAEALEPRTLLAVTLGPIVSNDLPATKEQMVALPLTNTTVNPVTYTVESSNPNVTASIVTGGRSLLINVSGVDGNNVAFTGDITLRLFESANPVTTARIISLIQNDDFYDGLLFHRIIDDFVAQGGDPAGTGSGGTGTKFADEFNTALTFTSQGLLAMANSGDDTNDTQFFITDVDLPLGDLPQHLNFQHSIFGIVTNGLDVLRKLMATPTNSNDRPLTNAVINNVTVFSDTDNGVLRLRSAAGFTGSATITVTADDGRGSTDQESFTVNVVADTLNDRAFLGPVSNQTTNQGTPVTFTVQGFDLDADPLTFVVKDPATFAGNNSTGSDPSNVSVSIQVTPASGGNPASAAITLTPAANFSGTVNLMIGVRDQTNRGGTTLGSRINFDTQQITLTVNPVNRPPTTPGGSVSTPVNQAVNIQLTGDDGDADKTQTLTFEIVTQPQNGTLSNFNAATGAAQFTPTSGFAGTTSFTYRVRDNGGTANGGQDTSATATFTITVGAVTPTALTLSATSDDGHFPDDKVIASRTPTFQVSATPGSTVRLLVNGTTQVTATESSPGQFAATLTKDMVRVGGNTVTATSTVGTVTSPATSAFSFTYAPSYQEVYTVPGAPGTSQQVTFRFTSRNAGFDNEFGVYTVDNLDGLVGGLAPGSAGYAAAALASGRQILFSSGASAGGSRTLTLTGGQTIAFYLVADNTTAEFLRANPQNSSGGGPRAFFSVTAANPDGIDHVLVASDPQTGQVLMHWEDLFGGGDRDFNDGVITITPAATASSSIGEALRLPGGAPRNVPVTFALQPARNAAGVTGPSAARGELGVYVVSDNLGTVGGIAPGASGYLSAVLGSSTRQVLFNNGDAIGAQKTVQLPGGALIGWYYIPGGTAAGIQSSNPTNSRTGSPFALFSFDAANPDQSEHFRWFGPEAAAISLPTTFNGAGLQLHILDSLFASQTEFDDLLMSVALPV